MTRDPGHKLDEPLPSPVRDASGRKPRSLVKPTAIPRVLPVPDQVLQQELPFASTPPHVYVHEGARQRLQRVLRRHLDAPVMLQITDNRQRMFTARRVGPNWRVRLHHMFLDADETVIQALASYIRGTDGGASDILDRFIEQSAHKIRRMPRRRKPIALEWEGRAHDLKQIFDSLNRRYFRGRVGSAITWGRNNPGQRRRTIKLGSYNPEYRLIRIHPVLDQRWVPDYFVRSVVHHEMCHAFLHDQEGVDEGVRHSKTFRELERGFRHHQRAQRFQQEHLTQLLNY